MKKMIFSLLLLISFSAVKSYAQMEAAQKVNWDLDKQVDVHMEADQVWEIFTNIDLLKKASNGYVTAITVVDTNMPVSRKITFASGGSRLENITQQEAHNKLIAIDFADSNLPRGIKSAQYAIFIKAKGNQANVTWRGLVKGDAEAKKALVAQLMAEFDSYAAGLDKITKHVVPAAKLN